MELVCPAGNLPSLKAAVDAGADGVYLGFRDDTNARHFAGLNFTREQLREGVAYAHTRGRQVLLAINTYARSESWTRWQQAVDRAVELGVDALIIADMGVLEYAARRYPEQRLHLSVQASATSVEALRFYQEQFGIRRAVLPRVLSLRQVETLLQQSPVEIEVFGFGSLCVMAEGRCYLSSYVTGESPNTCGACSPARFVDWQERADGLHTRLNGVLIDRFQPEEQAGYPTLCKGRFDVCGRIGYAIESPTSLNALDLLPRLLDAGVAAVKLEGRQRSPAYVAGISRVWRAAIDACHRDPEGYRPRPEWLSALAEVAEGASTTPGAYHRPWQ